MNYKQKLTAVKQFTPNPKKTDRPILTTALVDKDFITATDGWIAVRLKHDGPDLPYIEELKNTDKHLTVDMYPNIHNIFESTTYSNMMTFDYDQMQKLKSTADLAEITGEVMYMRSERVEDSFKGLCNKIFLSCQGEATGEYGDVLEAQGNMDGFERAVKSVYMKKVMVLMKKMKADKVNTWWNDDRFGPLYITAEGVEVLIMPVKLKGDVLQGIVDRYIRENVIT